MDHSKKNTYLFSIDALRVMAILAVIVIHQTTTTLQVLNHNIEIAPFSLFYNQLARFAVPLFFLISGFVLELNYKEKLSYATFFKKRASRILIPYLFWSAFYFLLGSNFSLTKLGSLSFIDDLLNGTASYHLYFIPTLIIFYLAFPLLHNLINILKNPIVLISIFLIQLTIAYFNYYVKVIPLQEEFRVAILVFALFIIGMVFSVRKERVFDLAKKYFKPLIFLLLVFAVVIFTHVYYLTRTFETTRYIYNQFQPFNYIYTLILFFVLYYLFEKTSYLKKTFITLSKLSFIVFFIHVFVLQNYWEIILAPFLKAFGENIATSFLFDPIIFLIVSTFSFVIAFFIHKIPYASKITG